MIRKNRKLIAWLLSVAILFTGMEPAAGQTAKAQSENGVLYAVQDAAAVSDDTFAKITSDDAVSMSYGIHYSVGGTVTGSALYRITTKTADSYYQMKAFVTSGSALQLALYDVNRNTVMAERSFANEESQRFALASSAEYYLYVSWENASAGSVLLSEIRDDYVNQLGEAQAIAYNQDYSFTAEVAGDTDCVKFTVGAEDASYAFHLQTTAGSQGSYEILDSAGNRIQEYCGVTDGDTNIEQTMVLPQNKTYFIRVSSQEEGHQVVIRLDRTANTYSITYKLNGGTNHKSNPASYTAVDTVKLKKPTKKGYLFSGWYTESSFKTKVTTIKGYNKENLKLYAKWKKVTVGKTAITSLTSPKKGRMKVVFKKISNAKGYRIRIGRTANLKKKSKYYTVKTNSKLFKALLKGKKYYIKVQAYTTDSVGNKIYGAYSNKKALTVKK
ncbi:MAG: InlB B-repeat-containing protein [Clostridiaceae bacterium]|nr:InlB B-repeat-containing protein [Clostridiaceae bacterium]